ncbi:uncharacterized protein [Nothobranchius furzeri]|uniref:uncharacterized protein n=1 Tax=Nothobranchius furzeri TaxID=105023 RepID=UPI003904BBDB
MEGQSSDLTNSQQPGGAAAHDYEPGLLSGQILSKLVAVAREPDYPSRDFTEEQRSDELDAVIDQIENPDGTKPIQVHLAKLALILYQRGLQRGQKIMNLQSMLAEKQRNGRLIEEDDTRTDSGEDGEETPPPSADDNRQWEGGKHQDSLDGRTPQGRDEAHLFQPSAPFPTHTIGHSGPPRGREQFTLESQVGPSSSRPSQSVRSRPAEYPRRYIDTDYTTLIFTLVALGMGWLITAVIAYSAYRRVNQMDVSRLHVHISLLTRFLLSLTNMKKHTSLVRLPTTVLRPNG